MLLPVVEGAGYELVDLRILAEGGRTILRLMADRPGGITLDECARLSREVSPHLDVADVVPYAYNLEVSSPGLRRPLKKAADFVRFAGEKVEVTTLALIEGRKRFKGVNKGLDEKERILVEMEGETHAIPFNQIASARLDPELPFGNRTDKR